MNRLILVVAVAVAVGVLAAVASAAPSPHRHHQAVEAKQLLQDALAIERNSRIAKAKKRKVSEFVMQIHAALMYRHANGLGYFMCWPECFPQLGELCTISEYGCCRKRDGGMTKCFCDARYEPGYGWYGVWVEI